MRYELNIKRNEQFWNKMFATESLNDTPGCQMVTVLKHQLVSLKELFPYFPDFLIEHIKDKISDIQIDLPLISLETIKLTANSKGIANITYRLRNIHFVNDTFILKQHFKEIVETHFFDRRAHLELTIIYEEKDFDGLTKSQKEIISDFRQITADSLRGIVDIYQYSEPFAKGYTNYYIDKTIEITKLCNVKYDRKVVIINI